LKTFLFAFYQLTKLPLPVLRFDEKACGRSTIFFPAVGLVLGLLLVALWWAAGLIFPVFVQASLLIAGMFYLTGGIHLDGFMDTVDGILSGKQRERKLEIMRDSRVGALGVAGFFCLYILKFALLCEMPGHLMIKVLPVVFALSRWGMAVAVAAFPYAREEGLGKVYSVYTGAREALGASIIAAAAAGVVMGMAGICLMVLSGVVTVLAGKKLSRELGGLTGDTYGFINEFMEVLLLAAVFPLLKINEVLQVFSLL